MAAEQIIIGHLHATVLESFDVDRALIKSHGNVPPDSVRPLFILSVGNDQEPHRTAPAPLALSSHEYQPSTAVFNISVPASLGDDKVSLPSLDVECCDDALGVRLHSISLSLHFVQLPVVLV